MTADIGHYSLILALLISTAQSCFPMIGAPQRRIMQPDVVHV